jgi:hypothetical protein
MTKRYMWALVLVAIMLVSEAASAADKKIPIYLQLTTNDTVGTTFGYTLREQLKASQSYEVVLRQADALFVIGVVSMGSSESGRASDPTDTVTSIVLLVNNADGYDYFLDQWVMRIGRERTAVMATDIIAAIDKDVQEVVRAALK